MNTIPSARAFAFAMIFSLCASHLGPTPAHALPNGRKASLVASSPAPAKAADHPAPETSSRAASSTVEAADSLPAAVESSSSTTMSDFVSDTASDSETATASDLVSDTASDSETATASDSQPVTLSDSLSTRSRDSLLARSNDSLSARSSDSLSAIAHAAENVKQAADAVSAKTSDENESHDQLKQRSSSSMIDSSLNKANEVDSNLVTEATRRSANADYSTVQISDATAADTIESSTSVIHTSADAASSVAASDPEFTSDASDTTADSESSTSGRRKNDGVSDVPSATDMSDSVSSSKVADETSPSTVMVTDVSTADADISSFSESDATSRSKAQTDSFTQTSVTPTPFIQETTAASVQYASDVPASVVQTGLPYDQDQQSRRAFNQMARKIASTVALSMDGLPDTNVYPTQPRYIIQTVAVPYSPYPGPTYSSYPYTFYNYFHQLNPTLPTLYTYPTYNQAGLTYPTVLPTRMTNVADPVRSPRFRMRIGPSTRYQPLANYGIGVDNPVFGSHTYDSRRFFKRNPANPRHQFYFSDSMTAPNYQTSLSEIGETNPNMLYNTNQIYTHMKVNNGRFDGYDHPRRFNIAYMGRKSRSLSAPADAMQSDNVQADADPIDDKLVERIFRRREK